jgi:hypothetical protein
MTKKFNRKYKAYQPDAQAGPPTERICKPVKCQTDDDGTTDPPFDKDAMDEEIREAREEYLTCVLLCESAYCNSVCNRQYQEKVQDIYDKYGYQP